MVQLGYRHACSLLDNNTVKCWGQNNSGQLGQEDTITRGNGLNEMGDDLAAVDLVPDMIDLVWGGYSSNNITYRENAPSLNAPTGYPTGATFSYSTTTADVCTVVAGTGVLTIVSSGTCRVSLTVSASNYRSGVRTFDLTVGRAVMSNFAWRGYTGNNAVTFPTVPALVNPTGMVSGATLAYSTVSSTVCSVNSSSGALTLLGTGNCVVKVVATATGYSDATVSVTVVVSAIGSALATWTGYTPSTATFGGATPTLNAPGGGPEGVSVSYAYASTTTNVCTVNSSGALTLVRDGTCTIRLTASATNYRDTTIDRSITINKGTMSSFAWSGYAGSNAVTFPTAPALVNPTGMASGATLAYSTVSSTVCSVNSSSGALTLLGTGNCVVKVVVTAAGYSDATVSVTVVVSAGGSALATWTGYTPSTATFGGAVPTLNSPGGAPEGVSVTYAYASTTTSVCTVSSTGALTLLSHGTCTIRLTASASNYSDTTLDRSVTVNKGTMSNLVWLGYTGNNTATFPNAPAPLDAVRGPRGVRVTYRYTSNTENICTVVNTTGVLTLVRDGTCTITLTASAPNYIDATINRNITIRKGTMSNFAWRGYADSNSATLPTAPALVNPTGMAQGATLAYSTMSPGICSVNSSTGTLNLLATGNCVVKVVATATGYNNANATVTVTVSPGEPPWATWTGYTPDTTTFAGMTPTLNSPGGAPEGVSVTYAYASKTTSVCTVEKFERCSNNSGKRNLHDHLNRKCNRSRQPRDR